MVSRGEQMAPDNDVCEKGTELSPGSIYLPAGVPRSFTMWSRDVPQRQLDSRPTPIILKSNWIASRMIVVADSAARYA